MKKRLTAHFEGRVQGVGFRLNACRTAAGYEVTGTVRNLDDGRVELVAEGEEAELQAFLEGIAESPLGNYVRAREEAWEEPGTPAFKSFRIVD
ncbi:acylphosphatase [Verrucomicrobium sp. GAS474]|uniref:acylphosphatase n=1 Tax=Verrucomicrobium sp. GAS474 TaxID=1882831 RepID=UPI00087ACD6E|nr:acylphosphatase [Verrucomicrobium sp. GAS474]SDT93696.1 acylphosphatase [Verrucomicrobium sp. GAS474]